MNLREHLLTILAEECSEVAKNASKALRFGVDEVYRGPENPRLLSNRERIVDELEDLRVIIDILKDYGIALEIESGEEAEKRRAAKRMKVFRYVGYARERGTILP